MISCDKHDYIEIACMYRLKVLLKLKTGDEIIGVAHDTSMNDTREECIQLLRGGDVSQAIVLSDILTMRAVNTNPHFDCVEFEK